MKKILIFSIVYYPQFVGGAEIALKEITDRIAPDACQFDMITLCLDKKLPRFERIGNINIYRIGWTGTRMGENEKLPLYLNLNKYAYPFLAYFKARSLHRHKKYDIVWSMMANYAGFAALFFKYHFRKVPFLLSLQEGDPISYIKQRVGSLYPLFHRIFTYADRIQTISTYLADFAKSMGAKAPIVVVPNGVDVRKFEVRSTKLEIEETRKELGFVADDIVLITTSRLVEKNAVGDIIKSLEFLPDNRKLLILGSGPLEASLQKLVENASLQSRVKFLGYVPHEALPKYLAVSDIYIRPSLSEGFGNSFIEAMAAKVPVIATRVGGIPDFLEDKRTGLFCGLRDPNDIAHKVEILLRDHDLRDSIVEEAYKMVKEKYDWDIVASAMTREVFEKL